MLDMYDNWQKLDLLVEDNIQVNFLGLSHDRNELDANFEYVRLLFTH